MRIKVRTIISGALANVLSSPLLLSNLVAAVWLNEGLWGNGLLEETPLMGMVLIIAVLMARMIIVRVVVMMVVVVGAFQGCQETERLRNDAAVFDCI